jgi:hypothetical protein
VKSFLPFINGINSPYSLITSITRCPGFGLIPLCIISHFYCFSNPHFSTSGSDPSISSKVDFPVPFFRWFHMLSRLKVVTEIIHDHMILEFFWDFVKLDNLASHTHVDSSSTFFLTATLCFFFNVVKIILTRFRFSRSAFVDVASILILYEKVLSLVHTWIFGSNAFFFFL